MGNGCAQGVNKDDATELKGTRRDVTERNVTGSNVPIGGRPAADAKALNGTTAYTGTNNSSVGAANSFVNTSISNAKPVAGYNQSNVFSYNFPAGNNSVSTYSAGINGQPI